MFAMILSQYELVNLFEWLSPKDIVAFAGANRECRQAAEEWSQTEGVPRTICIKKAEIDGICHFLRTIHHQTLDACNPFEFQGINCPTDLEQGLELLFKSYRSFLAALVSTPLSDTAVNINSWIQRYAVAMRPRPAAVQQVFDYGYPKTGYWCDPFGCGASNDYFRLVGNEPNEYWSLCLAGSDAHHIRWRYAFDSDPTLDPVPLSVSNRLERAYIQTAETPTEWDSTRAYWRNCGTHIGQRI